MNIDVKSVSCLITAVLSVFTTLSLNATLNLLVKIHAMGKNYEDDTKRVIGRYRLLVTSYEEENEELKTRCIELENRNIFLENRNNVVENACIETSNFEIKKLRKAEKIKSRGLTEFFK